MMETTNGGDGKFLLEDHEVSQPLHRSGAAVLTTAQGAYIFKPGKAAGQPTKRPLKRRRTSKEVERVDETSGAGNDSLFVPLLGGAESPACVRLREKVFEKSWAAVEGQVQAILRNANTATLDEVTSFVREPNMPEYAGGQPRERRRHD